MVMEETVKPLRRRSMSRIICLVLITLCLLAGQFQSPQAQAQSDYPSKPVKIIVPSAPGGGTDISARVLAQYLSQSTGQQFFIENRPGAGNMIGIEAVARSVPDGYTLLMTASTLTINHLTYKKVLYDTVRDFAPISLVVSLPSLLVVHPSVPARSLAELIALAKQKPDQLTYGSAGLGTNPHLSMELFKTMAGIEIRHIPYKGVGPALNDLIAGQVSSLIAGLLTTKPQVEAGTLRGLAVTGAKRAESLPNIPTVAEAGVPSYEALQWYGLLAPAGTPPAIVTRLHAETAKAVRTKEMKERLAADGAEPVGNTPAEFAAHIQDEMKKWAAVARAAKIEPQ
jgi:tripartite-type tricarboxylate transporter receptor subunit TctC